jgi:hypothetical protein
VQGVRKDVQRPDRYDDGKDKEGRGQVGGLRRAVHQRCDADRRALVRIDQQEHCPSVAPEDDEMPRRGGLESCNERSCVDRRDLLRRITERQDFRPGRAPAEWDKQEQGGRRGRHRRAREYICRRDGHREACVRDDLQSLGRAYILRISHRPRQIPRPRRFHQEVGPQGSLRRIAEAGLPEAHAEGESVLCAHKARVRPACRDRADSYPGLPGLGLHAPEAEVSEAWEKEEIPPVPLRLYRD